MSATYHFGSTHLPGLAKLIEEAGEVQQVAGKILGHGGLGTHWDGSDLRARMEEEIGDLMAACRFFADVNGLDEEAIVARCDTKIATFRRWHREQAE